MKTYSAIGKLVSISVIVTLVASVQVLADGGYGIRPANPDPSNHRTNSIFIYNLKPGEQKADQVNVVNNTDTTRTLSLDVVDSTVTSTGTFSCRQHVEEKQLAGAWLRLAKKEVTLAPHSNEVIDFTVQVPLSAEPGEAGGCVTIQDNNEQPAQDKRTGMVIATRQALRVAVIVPGDIHRQVTIDGFDVSLAQGEQSYTVKLKNTGNVSADTKVKLKLTDMFGKVVYENGGEYPVVRDTTLELPFTGGYRQVSRWYL